MNSHQAEIISIGNEVLAGYTVNTNATFISQQLLSIGLPVNWVSTIRDEHNQILSALKLAAQRARVVLVTGGLGPTPDDLTKKAICDYFNVGMREDKATLENVIKFLKSRNIDPGPVNKAQALIPDCDQVIPNRVGTAPCLVFIRENTHFFFMPGVPGEMKRMLQDYVLDYLKQHLALPLVHTALLRTTGIPESKLYEKLKTTFENYPEIDISYLPRYIGVDLRFRLISQNKNDLDRLTNLISKVDQVAHKYIFSAEQKELEQVLAELLIDHKLTMAVAESFTGGLISDLITNIPGSSNFYLAGLTTYSNESKMGLLGVSAKTLERHGAVSLETVREMVRGVQEKFNSDCAIATTGIAGPGGATPTKPVGLAFIAVRLGDQELIKEFHFGPQRLINKKRGAVAGMELLRRVILDLENV